MYRRPSPGQLSFENFYLPFGGKLSSDNRWVKLSELIPWEQLESSYAEQFSTDVGAPAIKFRVALGALIIKEKLGCTDRELVEQIRENPYLQFFIGMGQYSHQEPFHPSMLVHFRKRFDISLIGQFNEQVIESNREQSPSPSDIDGPPNEKPVSNDSEEDAPSNRGMMLADATCAPADISYPTDLKLLNQAREYTEEIIDVLFTPLKPELKLKPRTYRKKARKAFLKTAKKRKITRKQRRKAVGQQLRYVQRNLRHIDTLIEKGASLSWLSSRQYRLLLVVSELYRQQWEMYQAHKHRVEHRIVSLTQPHVRPIVRGKAGVPVEFGAKLQVSLIDGFVHLDYLDWENFNESTILIEQIEAFRDRNGTYPESVHVDQVFRTRENRRWCRERHIRMSGPALGRPKANPSEQEKQQAREDENLRVAIEGKFGQGKRRFSLGHIMTKLAETSETAIAITLFVMNLERLLRQLPFLLYCVLRVLQKLLMDIWEAIETISGQDIDELNKLEWVA